MLSSRLSRSIVAAPFGGLNSYTDLRKSGVKVHYLSLRIHFLLQNLLEGRQSPSSLPGDRAPERQKGQWTRNSIEQSRNTGHSLRASMAR